MKYRFFKKSPFESLEKYEKRLNDEASLGWRVINFVSIGNHQAALLEKLNPERYH
ncbi:MAG: hypothetical protein JXQ87_13900 [Bacteroidia bacterium]